MIGRFKKHSRPDNLPYNTMSQDQLKALPVGSLADTDCHLWLWTTNRFLEDGFELMRCWGFKYHNAVSWVKPSGMGAYFINRVQVLLFGYRGKIDMKQRYKPNVLFAPARKHSQKPECSYELIEAVSHPAYLELFARNKREGWTVLGNGIDGRDITTSLLQQGKK